MGGGAGSGKGMAPPPQTKGGSAMMAVDPSPCIRPLEAGLSRHERPLTRSEGSWDDDDTASTSAATESSTSSFDSFARAASRKRRQSPEQKRPHHPPRGLLNLGNTCYANAALQCLFATALPHALLDRTKAEVFRRYASNGNLMELGTGSVDSLDEEDDIGGGGSSDKEDNDELMSDPDGPFMMGRGIDDEDRARRREERRKRREARKKEMQRRDQRELCQWLTGEMTDLTKNYTAAPKPRPEPQDSGFFGSFFGSSTPSTLIVDAVDPGSITRNVHKLCSTMRPYQQEDAHEFLRALLSGLVMDGQNRRLSSLFDGLLESAVTCQTCRYSSLTRDRYMDLSLDIADSTVFDVPSALRHFTKTETLDCDNMVECGRCKEKRIVSKGLRLATAPTVLVLQLKRFGWDLYGRTIRIGKDVTYPLRLEIGDYMSRANRSTPPPYELVGVLVHSGRSCDSGHYLSYVKNGKKWYKANDAVVSEVTEEVALRQKAYILVYEVAGMKAKHGCDSYHRYHRKERHSRGSSSPRTGARDDIESPSRRNVTRDFSPARMRSQSAPRPAKRSDPGRRALHSHRRGQTDDSSTRACEGFGQSERARDAEGLDACAALSSLFGLLDFCGSTGHVAHDDYDDVAEVATLPTISSLPSAKQESAAVCDDACGSSVRDAPVPAAEENKDVIGIPRSMQASPARKRGSKLSKSGSAKFKRSSSSGSARDLERYAARAYRKKGRTKRIDVMAELDEDTRGTSSSDCESDVPSHAATDVMAGSSSRHRRAKSLSRIVHRAAAKAAHVRHSVATPGRPGRLEEILIDAAGPKSPSGKAQALRKTHQRGHSSSPSASRSKSRSRGSQGDLPPLHTGK